MSAKADFEDRAIEVREFIKFLKKVESSTRRLKVKKGCLYVEEQITDDNFKVMKASTFLVIYNLVEAAIRSGIEEIYREVETEGVKISSLSPELRELLLSQRHYDLASGAAPRKYRELLSQIVLEILDGASAKLQIGKITGIAGSLDAQAIRDICSRHGISSKAHYSSKGGSELLIVKQKRNSLAHGSQSFVECGREYSLEDLSNFASNAIVFTRSILKNMETFRKKKKYEAA